MWDLVVGYFDSLEASSSAIQYEERWAHNQTPTFQFDFVVCEKVVKTFAYTSRFVRVILAQGPCRSR